MRLPGGRADSGCAPAHQAAEVHAAEQRTHRAVGVKDTISVVKHYVDGIIAADPVSIQLRLPDGIVIAATGYNTEAVVRRKGAATEVFEFSSSWVPIATRIHRFDGYSLSEITTSAGRLVSPLVHTRAHWINYVVTLAFAAVFLAGWFGTRAIPRRGWLSALRGVGFVGVVGATVLYVLIVFWIKPISPFVLFFLGAICFALWRLTTRFLKHAPTA
jgi:hypothetical protein